MDLMNCVECGHLFVKVTQSEKICSECFSAQKQEFEILKQFIRSNGKEKTTLQHVSRSTGVSINKIINFVKEGSIQSI